jgi:hypothetical protein
MTEAKDYLTKIKAKIVMSPIIASMTIVTEYALADRGYFRARLTLINGDFLEVSEFFTGEAEAWATKEYRYQWMNASQQRLIKRWDNAEHFADLPNFPHHIHVDSETHVIPGKALSIIELLDGLELELSADRGIGGSVQ